jgi:hypothetical protein
MSPVKEKLRAVATRSHVSYHFYVCDYMYYSQEPTEK